MWPILKIEGAVTSVLLFKMRNAQQVKFINNQLTKK